jgi:hypothetical protein
MLCYNGGDGIAMPGRIASTPGVSRRGGAPVAMPQSTPVQLPLQIEEWRPVPDWEGWYEVSSFGRVRRVGSARPQLQPRPNSCGYPQVCLRRGALRRQPLLHRVVAAAFLGPCPDGHEVNHRDCDKANAAVSNLEYVTRKENYRHAVRMGRIHRSAAGRGGSKLSADDVRIIRRSSLSSRAAARVFGIDPSYVRQLRRGRWRTDVE